MICPKNTDYTVGSVVYFWAPYIFSKCIWKERNCSLIPNPIITVTFNVQDLIPAALTGEKTQAYNEHIRLSWTALDCCGCSSVTWFSCYINCTLHSSSTLLSPTFRAVTSWLSSKSAFFRLSIWSKMTFSMVVLNLFHGWHAFIYVVRSMSVGGVSGSDVNLQDEWCQKWASENIIIDLCNASCVHFLRIFDAYRCLFKWVVCWAMWMVKTSWFQCTPSIAFSAA